MKYVIFTLIIIFTWSGTLQDQGTMSWPEFRGPKRDNISPAKGLLKIWPKNGPKMIWQYKGLGKGFSSVSISDNMIFTAGTKGDKTYVFAFDYYGKFHIILFEGSRVIDPKSIQKSGELLLIHHIFYDLYIRIGNDIVF